MKYTRDEVADDARVPLEAARVLWRSMGYADVGEAVAFTDEPTWRHCTGCCT